MPAITPTGYNALKLLGMRDKLKKQFERNVTWNEVLSHFFHELKSQGERIKELEQQVEDLGGKVEHKTEVMEEVLLNLSRQAAAPVMMQANPIMTQLSSPPPPPLTPPKAKPRLVYNTSGNLKKDYVQEIKQVFTGEVLKPSAVLQLTEPQHKDTPIVEITEIPILKEAEDKSFYKIEEKN
jgi:hypothetical protein